MHQNKNAPFACERGTERKGKREETGEKIEKEWEEREADRQRGLEINICIKKNTIKYRGIPHKTGKVPLTNKVTVRAKQHTGTN